MFAMFALRACAWLYVFLLPCTDLASGLGSRIALSTAAAFLMVAPAIVALMKRGGLPKPDASDALLMIVAVMSFVSFAASDNLVNEEKTLNHAFARPIAFVLFYWVPLVGLNAVSTLESTRRALVGSMWTLTVWTLFEYAWRNILGWSWSEWLPRLAAQIGDYEATSGGTVFRVRGTVEESGHLALCLELLMPLAIGLQWGRTGRFPTWLALSGVVAVLATVSTAAFTALPIAAAICLVPRMFVSQWTTRISARNALRVLGFAAVLGVILVGVRARLQEDLLHKYGEGDFGGRGSNVSVALEQLGRATPGEWLVGFGPGSSYMVTSTGGILSLYVSSVFEMGLIGAVAFFGFLAREVWRARAMSRQSHFVMAYFGLISGLIHYAGVHNYWYPWLWFLAAMSRIVHTRESVASRVSAERVSLEV